MDHPARVCVLFTVLAGCHPAATPTTRPDEPRPAPTEPKGTTQSEPKAAPKSEPAKIEWQTGQGILNAPGYLETYRPDADPEKAWRKVRGELAKDAAAMALLKKLVRAETVEIEVRDAPPPDEFRPSRPPGAGPDRVLAVYLTPGKKGKAFDVRYSVLSARSPAAGLLFGDASEVDAFLLAVNDYLLRNDLGCTLHQGLSLGQAGKDVKTAGDLRKKLDAEIARHLKRNEP